ncbi:class I SAM-dependent methyltransferase [Legionella quinlivanii]|uniref:class I SAM-dependent methyltransferase n=1 Tax=Legionella quinlivanii TaxID=45073 RepID=UPI0022439A8F|nr:class I SAM-dependent methyltransferase [Legionella quinlivanii]MCW8452219.1 class I SAM-dependent methyltransferase [Legionella quinlivanii]
MLLAPGTILQRMYLKERLALLKPGFFVEIGIGDGSLSSLLCQLGWKGIGFEINEDTAEKASQSMKCYVDSGQYEVRQQNWLYNQDNLKADLIVSSMVIEHLNESEETLYFKRCESALAQSGICILLVPSSMKYWGIEDEIAGHYKRYSKETLSALMHKLGWEVSHYSSLTYPFSNILFPVSEYLVRKAEKNKLSLSMDIKTKLSGNRQVPYKTSYPKVFKLILNEKVLFPFHWLQKKFSNHPDALVAYLECKPLSKGGDVIL